MPAYAVYETGTGEAVSFTSTEPDDLSPDLDYVEIHHQPDVGEAWDPATLGVVGYTPAPSDPAGGLYEQPTWSWVYAVGPYRLPASATGDRTAQPSDATAQAYIRANATQADVQAAVLYAASRRDALSAALTAVGIDPATSDSYTEAQAVLAFLGACLT